MAIQQEKVGFALRSAIGALTASVASFWKPMLIAAPLIGAALFLASGTQAQTSSSAAPSASTSANGPVAPIASPDAARTGRPKIKEKMATGRVANPSTPGVPAADVPIAPIDAPESARTGRPKERDKEILDTSGMAEPAPETEPVAQSTERRREGPKGDEGSGRTAPTPAPGTQPTGRRKGPKGYGSHGRTATTPLIIGALSAAAILALVVSGGNDRPASP